jgi:putative SOS response-associated peptidase YedK
MPVVLQAGDLERWLDPQQRDVHALADLFTPHDDEGLEAYPVGAAVGNARIDDPGLVQRVSDAAR